MLHRRETYHNGRFIPRESQEGQEIIDRMMKCGMIPEKIYQELKIEYKEKCKLNQ